MSLSLSFVPKKPFPNFKWKWASLQCTEGLNDPVVLLGVLFLANYGYLSRQGETDERFVYNQLLDDEIAEIIRLMRKIKESWFECD